MGSALSAALVRRGTAPIWGTVMGKAWELAECAQPAVVIKIAAPTASSDRP
jgi:hypothetical protein